MITYLQSHGRAATRARLARMLLDGTRLPAPVTRLAPAMFLAIGLAVGVSWPAGPARAENFNVANDGQLRNAISSAGNGDTITFTGNITLGSNLPTVTKNVTVNGGLFTLSGDNKYRGLFVQSGTVAINDLAIKDAVAQGGRGGNGEEGGAGGGGAGLGGALFVATGAQVTVSNVSAQNGSARGGNGGNSGTGTGSTSGGGGGYWITGSDGEDAGFFASGNGGAGGGGAGFQNQSGANGGFGGGGGGSASVFGGTGGFGGGGGGGSGGTTMPGGFGGGTGGAGTSSLGGGGGGGGGFGGAIFVQQGGTLNLASSINVSGNTVAGGSGGSGHTSGKSGAGAGSGIFLGGNGTLTLTPGAGQTQTISDAIVDQTGAGGTGADAGSWALVKGGTGTTILTGANAYTGGITVGGGVLQGNSASLKGNILNNASVIFDQAGAGTYAGNMSGSGALTVRGSGAVTFTGANTYSGGTAVDNGGTLLFTSDTNLGAAGHGISLNNGTIGVESGAGGQTFSRPVTITSSGGMSVGEHVTSPVTWSGPISGTGRLVKSGSGTLILSGSNTYSGGTLVTSGGLLFTTDANLGAAGTDITLNGGGVGTTNDAVAALSITRPVTLVDRGSISVGINPLTWSGNITGSGRFIKEGLGVLTLTGLTNTYSGGTFVAQGTLQVASDDKLGAAGTDVTLYNGGSLWASQSFTTGRPITLLDGGGTFQVDAGQTLTLNGTLQGTNFTKVGAGTLVLAGTSSYTGNIFQNGGTVQGNASTVRGNIAFDANAQNLIARSVTFDQATDGTFAGNITGIGSLTKIGAGKLILSGDNSYSTGTTVAAGTLQGTSKSLQGAIANNAAVIFDQAFDGTYAGNMTGSGMLTKNGTGNLNLTGISSVGGGTTINTGGFAVNGHLTSDVTLNKDGTLSGVGNITGDITNNGGTIKPGNSIGHLKVNGNFTFNGGTYEVEINPQGDSDRVSVIGAGHKVMIHAGTLLVVPDAGIYTPNTTYTIITTEAGGTVFIGDVAGGVGFMVPEASLDPDLHSIYLTLALPPDAFRSAGQTPNQRAVGGALDALAASGNVGGIVTAMANLNSGQGAPAIEALSGEVHASLKGALLEDSRFVIEAALDRMRAAFTGGAAPSLPVMSYGPGGPRPSVDSDGFAAWTRGFGSWGEWQSDGNAADFERSIGGVLVGADALFAETWRLGLLAGYSHTSFDVGDRASSGESDNYHLGLYGGTRWGNLGLRLGAAHTWHDIETSRLITFPGFADSAQASYDARTAQVFGEFGYRIDRGGFAFEPFANLAYVNVHTDGFTEEGGAAALTSATSNSDATFTTLGLRATTDFRLGEMDATARGTIGWRHAFGDTIPTATSAFAGSDAFTIAGTPIADNALVLEAGLDIGLSEKTSLGVSYSGQIGDGASDHGFRADLTVKF